MWLWALPLPSLKPHRDPFFLDVLTQCDFEDDAKPLCDWSQVSADDGDWVRASGPSPTGSTGAPGGYPNGGEGLWFPGDHEQGGGWEAGVARWREKGGSQTWMPGL